jgi:hypothetical protein
VVGRADDALVGQHLGVRQRALDVDLGQAVVEEHRCGIALDEIGDGFRKASRPGFALFSKLVCHIGNSGEWAIIASTTAPSHGHAAGNAAGRGFFAFHHRPVARFFIRSQRVVMESFVRRQTSQSFHVASFLLVVFAQALLRRQKAMY